MIPDRYHLKWRDLLAGKTSHQFDTASGGMLIFNISRKLKKNPSEENFQSCLDDAVTFFKKYEIIFSDDLEKIFK